MLVDNITACIGPDFVVYNSVNLSTGIKYIYIFTYPIVETNIFYLVANLGFLTFNIILLYYGSAVRKQMLDMFLPRSRKNKVLSTSQPSDGRVQSNEPVQEDRRIQRDNKKESKDPPVEDDNKSD